MVYNAMGQPDRALDYYEQAQPIREEVGDRMGMATTLNSIGGIYFARVQSGKALEYGERALSICREVGATQHVIAQLANNATLLHESPTLGRQEEAIPTLEEAIALMEQHDLSHDGSGIIVEDHRRVLAQWKGEGQSKALVEILATFVNAPNWVVAREVLEAHPELLDPEVDAIFEEIIQLGQTLEGEEERIIEIEIHRELLRQCREKGIDAAFENLRQAWLWTTGGDDHPLPNQLVAIADNTIAVLTDAPARKEEWFGVVRRARARAEEHDDTSMVVLLGAVEKLLLGDDADSIQPDLSGSHAACWAHIVARLEGE
jgi:tetratricopeptide (TPR) repeat protein